MQHKISSAKERAWIDGSSPWPSNHLHNEFDYSISNERGDEIRRRGDLAALENVSNGPDILFYPVAGWAFSLRYGRDVS